MIGAIAGDIAGSIYEHGNIKTKDFELFSKGCYFTDDSVMTLAICRALMDCSKDFSDLPQYAIWSMQNLGREYPWAGYGSKFRAWIYAKEPEPYESFGNGAAMRVSGCAYIGTMLEEVKDLSRKVTEVTHNHPEGIKGAEATAVAIFLARAGKDMKEIRAYIEKNYYAIDFTLDEIRPKYKFDVTCQGSVPVALEAFFESTSFEDAIRNAISVGGDSDTIAAITGSIAEAYYGVPDEIREKALSCMPAEDLRDILERFETLYSSTPAFIGTQIDGEYKRPTAVQKLKAEAKSIFGLMRQKK